jgi:hypothetical protein
MTNLSWEHNINKELSQAQTARASGNEGMARVCARRAAGIAIGKFLAKNNLPEPGPSAMERLNHLYAIPDIPVNAKQAARLLTLQVDLNHELPVEADLIAEAYKLINSLIPEYQLPKE